MSNPTPRPALRKAADSDVHPAAPRPARSPRSRAAGVTVAPAPDAVPLREVDPGDLATPTSTAKSAGKSAGKSAATPSAEPHDTTGKAKGRKKDEPASSREARAASPARRKFSGSTSDHLRVPEAVEVAASRRAPEPAEPSRPRRGKGRKDKQVDLMGGKLVDLGATVPKNLRKAAREAAKARGLDVDTVVTDLLHAWLTERP